MIYDENDPREEIKNQLETLVALNLVTVTGITDDGEWLYSVTENALSMTQEERWEAIFGFIFNDEDQEYEEE